MSEREEILDELVIHLKNQLADLMLEIQYKHEDRKETSLDRVMRIIELEDELKKIDGKSDQEVRIEESSWREHIERICPKVEDPGTKSIEWPITLDEAKQKIEALETLTEDLLARVENIEKVHGWELEGRI